MQWWAFDITPEASQSTSVCAYLAIDRVANYRLASHDVANRPTQAAINVGSAACRALLIKLQAKIGLQGKLSDAGLPYRLLASQHNAHATPYFVSFSHSSAHIAVLVAPFAKLAVDIEDKPISAAVARRFFSHAENDWLATLTNRQQRQARQLLWCLKECTLKQRQARDSRLLAGIAHNILDDIAPKQLRALLTEQAGQAINCLYQTAPTPRLMGYLPTKHCAVMVCQHSCNNFAKKTQNFFVL